MPDQPGDHSEQIRNSLVLFSVAIRKENSVPLSTPVKNNQSTKSESAYSEGRIDGDVLFSWQCYAPRKQFADPVDRPVCYDAKHMAKVAFWIHVIQFARPDQAVQ